MITLFIRQLRRRRRVKALQRGKFDPDQIREANRKIAAAAKADQRREAVGRYLSHAPQYLDLVWTIPDLELED